MKTFAETIDSAIQSILVQNKPGGINPADLSKALNGLSLPGLTTLFGVGGLQHVPGELDPDKVRAAFSGLFAGNSGALDDNQLAQMLEMAGGKVGGRISKEEASEAWRLLQSGEFRGDLVDSTRAVLKTVVTMPVAAANPGLIGAVGQVVAGLFGRLNHIIPALPGVLERLVNEGDAAAISEELNGLLRPLFSTAPVQNAAGLIRELLHKDNRSVRLAILIYARMNGVELTEDDLDVVRDNVLGNQQLDLGPVLAEAWRRYSAGHGDFGALSLLQRLGGRE